MLIPAITGKEAVNDTERQWLSLPTRYGGMGITYPKSHALCSIKIFWLLMIIFQKAQSHISMVFGLVF